MSDPVNHPKHYTAHPSGVEAIDVCEHLSFNLGNAIKYIWRAGLKGDAVEDLLKAEWYLRREMKFRSSSDIGNRAFTVLALQVVSSDRSVLGDVLRCLLYDESAVEKALCVLQARVQEEIKVKL